MSGIRYSRLEYLPEIGKTGVEMLNAGRVLIIGCGALGSLCTMYLAASGTGCIAISDFDTIDISNLQRQLFYTESELGKSKCETLAERIRAINSEIEVITLPFLMTREKAHEYFPGYDFVIDGSDNPATKLMTASVCEEMGIPYCIGGVKEYGGQVMTWIPGHTGYTELFGEVGTCNGLTPCSAGGVFGPAAGIVASMQAAEAIKYISKAGQLLTDRLYVFDLRKSSAEIYHII